MSGKVKRTKKTKKRLKRTIRVLYDTQKKKYFVKLNKKIIYIDYPKDSINFKRDIRKHTLNLVKDYNKKKKRVPASFYTPSLFKKQLKEQNKKEIA